MRKQNGGRCVAERKLFHGTDSKYIDAICGSNFDWRICGTHGTAYGKGEPAATTPPRGLKGAGRAISGSQHNVLGRDCVRISVFQVSRTSHSELDDHRVLFIFTMSL